LLRRARTKETRGRRGEFLPWFFKDRSSPVKMKKAARRSARPEM